MFFQELREGQIALLVAAFHDVFKIAARLVSVDDQGEVEL